MPTYLQLRQQILRAIEQDVSITGDTVAAVNDAMATIMDELAADIQPLELLVTTAAVNVTTATTSVPLGSLGFNVSNLSQLRGVGVDNKASATPDIKFWEEISYEAYLRQNSPTEGNLRRQPRWTFTPSNTFILTVWPSGTETWDLYLNYYRQPTTISDAASPDLPAIYHRAIALGAITYFPQYFSGDRVSLFGHYRNEYEKAKKRILQGRRANLAVKSLNPRTARNGTNVNWGNGS